MDLFWQMPAQMSSAVANGPLKVGRILKTGIVPGAIRNGRMSLKTV
jgi:hypothetical protein